VREPDSKIQVKILTYNLFWWNLFDRRGGDGRSAGKLIAQTSGPDEYDIMAFQECDDRLRILNDARAEGLLGDYDALDGGNAIALAYRIDKWRLLDQGAQDVGEDSQPQYYGRRTAMWARLAHNSSNKTVFFVNHHGPLPVSRAGSCTGSATALNIMKMISDHAHMSDAIILVGDFNARWGSTRITELNRRLHHVYSGTAMRGIDHVYSNCPLGAEGRNLGSGGSDHDALSVTFLF